EQGGGEANAACVAADWGRRIRFHRIGLLRRMVSRCGGFEAIGKKSVGTEVPPTKGKTDSFPPDQSSPANGVAALGLRSDREERRRD
ncbi:hypothetical protein CATMIT_01669, partial [Catenibacterium mitsuokai DSM 15897]